MQQQNSSCANCGAPMMPDARFCRRCGQPSNPLERASVTEVTTRRLGAPGQPFMPGQDAAGQQSLEQQPGGQTRTVLSAETQGLRPASTLKRWLPGLLLLCIAVLIPAAYLIGQWRQPAVKIVRPTAPAVPQPPKPPPAPATTGTNSTSIDQSYIYPGSRTTMVVSRAGEGDMVQLQTEDSVDKVADWYTEKFKPTKIVRQPDNVVLKSGEMAVIITASGSGSQIMLRQGGK